MILQCSNITSLNANGDFVFGWGNQASIQDQNNNPAVYAGKVWFKKSGSGYVMGISKMGTTGGSGNAGFTNAVFDTTVHSTNEQVFVVVEYQIVGPTSAANDDIVRLWVN